MEKYEQGRWFRTFVENVATNEDVPELLEQVRRRVCSLNGARVISREKLERTLVFALSRL